ncbi:MAG: protease family protein [Candidatus Eremiobacteraeota bacterium]|jgi:membrane protease YdiL (CAAX protease family)|nr:protease family protein [Candidatus Eremiobacteraeota bacterium]
MSARIASPPRVFTRADGRDRVAVPFWNGILSAAGAIAIGFVVATLAGIALTIAIVLATGHTPSLNPGHPFTAAIGLVMYAAGGWFAWWRLRKAGRNPFRALNAHDIRTIMLGIAVLVLVRVGTGIQLVLTHQTNHVQAGFEHFDVVTRAPTFTAIGVGLAILTMVLVGPLVEELVFRGLLFGALVQRVGVIASALATALLFGLVHGDPVLFPTLAALGFVAALAYAATGNLWVSIMLHALNNALGAVFLVGASLQHHS